MAVPITRGSPYYVKFNVPEPGITPTENSSVSFHIGLKYGFRAGNSVIITKETSTSDRFEGIVSAYNPLIGVLTVSELTNIRGTWSGFKGNVYINLTGERGSGILIGTGEPTTGKGREGDVYIDTATGLLYIKTS
jgi:hypothetical protein